MMGATLSVVHTVKLCLYEALKLTIMTTKTSNLSQALKVILELSLIRILKNLVKNKQYM